MIILPSCSFSSLRSAKDSIEVKDRKASKHISVSQIASNGLLGTGLGINAERMVAV